MSEVDGADEVYVTCPQCLVLPSSIGTFERLPTIRDAVVVRNWPGVVERTPHKHWVDVGNIVAKYEIGNRQLIECSLNGHPHYSGHIARTRCGEILRQGNVCAEKSLRGMAEAIRFYSERERHLERVDMVLAVPSKAKAELIELAPELEHYAAYQREHEAGVEGRTMRQRLNQGAKGTEVEVRSQEYDPRTLRSKIVRKTVRLEGLKFWRTDFDQARCISWTIEANKLLDEAKDMDVKDEEAVRHLAERCERLSEAVKVVKKLVEQGREYFAPYNQKVVQAALVSRRAG